MFLSPIWWHQLLWILHQNNLPAKLKWNIDMVWRGKKILWFFVASPIVLWCFQNSGWSFNKQIILRLYRPIIYLKPLGPDVSHNTEFFKFWKGNMFHISQELVHLQGSLEWHPIIKYINFTPGKLIDINRIKTTIASYQFSSDFAVKCLCYKLIKKLFGFQSFVNLGKGLKVCNM